jgi:hypothetical protein
LLDLESSRPALERRFDDPAAMRLWFAELITYSEALTLSGVYGPFTDIGGLDRRRRGEAAAERHGVGREQHGSPARARHRDRRPGLDLPLEKESTLTPLVAHAAHHAFVTGFNTIALVSVAVAAVGSLAGYALVRSRDFVAGGPAAAPPEPARA